ncbi:hypothetical protein [Lacinutrix mariniflava]|uniref:hypothetical protein n=1 Tax=Lacinutrix mariniflava TaxID=342955 RepID=UPI0006E4170C|nr:hypothetical protein [Lacinutrix mariniflava]
MTTTIPFARKEVYFVQQIANKIILWFETDRNYLPALGIEALLKLLEESDCRKPDLKGNAQKLLKKEVPN